MTEELKPLPCPWCGGTNLKSGGDDKWVGVGCLTCGAIGPNHYETGRDWNTRSPAWRDIESAPRDGTPILAHRPNDNFPGYDDHAVVKWHEGTWMVHPTRDGRLSYIPTHWMPLPLPPEEGK